MLGANVVYFIFWLPLTIFLMGVSDVLYTWAVRKKEYKFLARNKLILALSTMILQIGIGLTDPGPIGFIVANLLGLLFANILLMRQYLHHRKMLQVNFSFEMQSLNFNVITD